MITRSESIAELVAALAKAQGAMVAAAKSNTNPHFKSKYADLASVWDAIREPLSANGLSVLQPVTAEGAAVTVTTILAHSSGQFISEVLTMTATQNTPQGVGSAITYGRRYALSALVGVAADADDDGNAASASDGREAREQDARPTRNAATVAPEGYAAAWAALEAAAKRGTPALREAYRATPEAVRLFAGKLKAAELEALKATAEKADAAAASEADGAAA